MRQSTQTLTLPEFMTRIKIRAEEIEARNQIQCAYCQDTGYASDWEGNSLICDCDAGMGGEDQDDDLMRECA